VKFAEDNFYLIAIHVEYVLTEFNKLHNTHIPPTLIKQIRERGIGKAQARNGGKEVEFVYSWNQGEKDRLVWPKETVVLVKTFLKKVLSFTEDCADVMLFTALHRL
jgi:hypothetical protein